MTDRREGRRVVNAFELSPPGAEFIDFGDDVERLDFSAVPRSPLERLIKRPKLSRYRAAGEAVRAAGGMPIISHLPRMTAAVQSIQWLHRDRSPHLAFAFNFTDLPTGFSLAYMKRALATVDRFIVFSEFERQLYPGYFALEAARFHYLRWAQKPPPIAPEPSPFRRNSYVSAVGGEGRDYASLIAAARRLPDIDFVIIARPYNQVVDLPGNVQFLTNVPLGQTWRIASDSSCLVVPLRDRQTCCGHITLVSGELLGLPVISTHSEATVEYTKNVALCEPGDVAALAALIRDHHGLAEERKAEAAIRASAKRADYDRAIWRNVLRRELSDLQS